MPLPVQQHGRLTTGPHQGRWVYIERDATADGWHIWVLQHRFGDEPNDGFDIWADDEAQVEQWLGDPEFQVSWADT